MSKHTKQRKLPQRVKFALELLYAGESVDETARKAHLSRERIERLAQTVGRSKYLTEGDKQMTEAQDHNTELGTTGVPYHSEEAEELIARRMRQLSASGRPAERMGVIRELVERGQIQSMVPGSVTMAAWNEELLQSIPPEKRG
jgi:hypothetical protein